MANAVPVHSSKKGKPNESTVQQSEEQSTGPEGQAGGVVQGQLPVKGEPPIDPRGVPLESHQAFRMDH